MKSTTNIVIGQRVDSVKIQRAKELRQQMTPAEKKLWQNLRTNRLDGFHFRRQQIIDGFIVDFYCHAARLVIEVDGGIHSQQVEYDQERDQVLSGRDLLVLRFTNREIHQQIDVVLAQIVKVCHERTEEPNPQPLPYEGRGEVNLTPGPFNLTPGPFNLTPSPFPKREGEKAREGEHSSRLTGELPGKKLPLPS